MDTLTEDIQTQIEALIMASAKKINEVINKNHPIILAKLGEDVFANKGSFNGHSAWKPNAPSTIKRKGRDDPNIDTGFLEHKISTPGFLESENWLDNIPNSRGYKAADKMRKFSDIGKTDDDEKYIEQQLEVALKNELT